MTEAEKLHAFIERQGQFVTLVLGGLESGELRPEMTGAVIRSLAERVTTLAGMLKIEHELNASAREYARIKVFRDYPVDPAGRVN